MKSILITSSILILLIAALRPILRGRIDPRVQYALWLAVTLRLLIPVNFVTSAYSALALLERANRGQDLVETIGQTAVPIPEMSYEDAYDQALREYHQDRPLTISFTDLAEVERRAREIQAKSPTLADLAAKYARPVWLGGAAVMALWFLLVNFRLRRKLRRAELEEAEQTAKLPVFVSDALPSPCLCGTFRPAIYVTPAALADPERMRHVLAHETTHYRHRDHWWALVRCLCLCLYWFDPLVWWAAAMSRQDCELACDAGAIRRLGEAERLSYGRTLVGMIAAGRCSLLQTATTMTGGKRRVRERVKLIARRPRTVIALALALVLILGLAVGCTFTGAPEKKAPTPMNLPAETLQERLLDVPEELRPTVSATASETKWAVNDIALVSYWLDEPIEWIDEQNYWLLDVHRLERNGIESYYDFLDGWFAYNDDCVASFIAQDEEFFYIVERPLDERFRMVDYEPFSAAYESIREFAVRTVLETEGVEPYSGQSMDTLRDRLHSIPAELQDDVTTYAGHLTSSPDLVNYWMKRDWTNKDSSGLGWLLGVREMSQEQFDALRNTGGGGWECFARCGNTYYALFYATDVRYYSPDDAEPFHNAFDAIRAYAMKTVLETEGVEPFDPYTTPPHFFSNVKQPPMAPGAYAYNNLDYTLVTSYQQVPEDPEQWYLAGYLPDAPVWMFTRGNGEETMFQCGEMLTQIFPYRARFYGGGFTHDGRAPQFMPLEGFGWGPKGTSGPFAVITHVFQGGTDQLYQLTVYDLDTDPVASYVHDWEPLMKDFNSNHQVQLHDDTHSATVSYQGQSAEIQFDEAEWENVRQYGFQADTYEYYMAYSFNSDGTFNLEMPVNPFTTPHIAVWTLRFTGSGFETTGFRFVQADDVYLYISSPH